MELFITYDAVHQLAEDCSKWPMRRFHVLLERLGEYVDWGLV